MVNYKGENVDQFFIDNYELVPYLINRFASGYSYNKRNELLENAILTYQKCVYSYDSSKGFKFSTYLSKCLYHYVLHSITRTHATFHDRMDHLDRIVSDDGNLTLLDMVEGDNGTENKVFIKLALEYVDENFNARDRAVFKRYLEGVRQNEIAEEFNTSQSYTSRIISKIQKELKNEFLVTS